MSARDLIRQEIERRKRERAERKRVWKQNMIRPRLDTPQKTDNPTPCMGEKEH